MPRKKIEELTSADFPGVDPARFEEWKAQQLRFWQAFNRHFLIMIPVIVVPWIFRNALGALLFFGGFVAWICYMLLYARPMRLQADALGREIGIDKAALKRALTGR